MLLNIRLEEDKGLMILLQFIIMKITSHVSQSLRFLLYRTQKKINKGNPD